MDGENILHDHHLLRAKVKSLQVTCSSYPLKSPSATSMTRGCYAGVNCGILRLNNMKPFGLLVCLLGLGISCSTETSSSPKSNSSSNVVVTTVPRTNAPFVLPAEFIRLTTADPTNDFNKAILEKDFRYIGLMGFSLYTPGVTPTTPFQRNRINVVEGTSDYIRSDEQLEGQNAIEKYAKVYNLLMQDYLSKTNR
ncbi:MAG: hypothetical protein JWM04_1471 [Verrucomicrobiales bacterium]|nr:hypothetical protein [Verrucomicrobiales bacterium]